MKLYNPSAACPKCGHKSISSVYEEYYHPMERYYHDHMFDKKQEHICRTCQRCGYQWPEEAQNEQAD